MKRLAVVLHVKLSVFESGHYNLVVVLVRTDVLEWLVF